jgi:hypothetical protein
MKPSLMDLEKDAEAECRRFLSIYSKDSAPSMCRRAIQPILDSLVKINTKKMKARFEKMPDHDCGNPDCELAKGIDLIKRFGDHLPSVCPIITLAHPEDDSIRKYIGAVADENGSADIIELTIEDRNPSGRKISLEQLGEYHINAVDLVEAMMAILHNNHVDVVATQAPARA